MRAHRFGNQGEHSARGKTSLRAPVRHGRGRPDGDPAAALHRCARPASSNSCTASWLFSATAICAPRVSRSTSARAWTNSLGSPSHHSASAAIASTARSGSPWTYSAKYSANDATTRARRRASSSCTASVRSNPVEESLDILRPFLATVQDFPNQPVENGWSEDPCARSRWLAGDSETDDLANLLLGPSIAKPRQLPGTDEHRRLPEQRQSGPTYGRTGFP
jgi:hypothetical protein